MKNNIILYALIFILVFTLPFKFGILSGPTQGTYPPIVSVTIGIVELTATFLLAFKKYRSHGALLAICIFSGAIIAHIFLLGIWYGKILFPLAVIGLGLSIFILKNK